MKFIIALFVIGIAVNCLADLVIVGPEGQVAGIGRQGIYARDRDGQTAGISSGGSAYARDRHGQSAGVNGNTAYAQDREGQVGYKSPETAYARDKHGNVVGDIH